MATARHGITRDKLVGPPTEPRKIGAALPLTDGHTGAETARLAISIGWPDAREAGSLHQSYPRDIVRR
jgi:hypothetical protein